MLLVGVGDADCVEELDTGLLVEVDEVSLIDCDDVLVGSEVGGDEVDSVVLDSCVVVLDDDVVELLKRSVNIS